MKDILAHPTIMLDCSITKQTVIKTMEHREKAEQVTFNIAKSLIEDSDLKALVPFSLVYLEDNVCNTENIEMAKNKIEHINNNNNVKEKFKKNAFREVLCKL